MLQLVIGALVVAALLTMAGHAVSDTAASLKAASAGQWATVEKLHGRRFSQRFADAWGQRRAERHAAATPGGARRGSKSDGADYRPGARAYTGDLYHGFWERRIEKSQARRDAKGPVQYSGPVYERIKKKVADLRARRGEQPADDETSDQPDTPAADTDTPEAAAPDRPVDDRDDIPNWVPPAQAAAYADYLTELDRRGELAAWRAGLDEMSELERRAFWSRIAASDLDSLETRLRVHLRETDPQTQNPPTAAGEADPSHTDTTEPAGTADPVETASDNDEEAPMTAPTGEVDTNTAAEVNTNTDLRRLFNDNNDDGRQLLDLVAAMEADLAAIAAAAGDASDYTTAASFDTTAVQAANEIAGAVSAATITAWALLADAVIRTSTEGLSVLEKWQDTEDLIATNQVDGSTLAAAGA